MSWWVALLLVSGGGLIGGAIGAAWGLVKIDKAQQVASNTAIAIFATTVELNYGEDFLDSLIDECKVMMREYPDLISDTARKLTVNQWLREQVEEKGKVRS